MRKTYYQAYQQMLEAEQSKRNEKFGKAAKKVEIKNDKLIKPAHIKHTVGKMNTAEERVEHEIKFKKEEEQENTVIRASQNGLPVDKKAREFIRAKDANVDFRKGFKSPFYTETKGRCSPKSGIFSTDENAVAAALSMNVPSNKAVQSKMIEGDYLFDKDNHIGAVDALTLHCWNGNTTNVTLILRAGYNVPSSYDGYNPITAAVRGRSLATLRLVLSIPKIADLVNKKDGFGDYPLDVVASMKGAIDPYEFAKVLIECGARDDVRTDKSYSAAMLTLVNKTWTPNLFGELLPVTDLEKKSKEGLTLRELAEKLGNREAVFMIDNFEKFGIESVNQGVTHSVMISHI